MSTNETNESDSVSVFAAVGGDPFFAALTGRFYAAVADNQVLASLHPADLGPSEERTRLFFIQYWGGPSTYSDNRGHPRLRMRHAHVPIGELERDEWLTEMLRALSATAEEFRTPQELVALIADYLAFAADAMVNVRGASNADTSGNT